nr:DUF3104 domain-containing protein [Synechococcus sp. UW179A]
MRSTRSEFPAPGLLDARPGNFVIIRATQPIAELANDDWWMGQIIWCESRARHLSVDALLQVANVDDGSLRWVNASEVTHVLHALDGIGAEQ